jgi:CMP-N-acetylneuraminic acid synthetase
MVSTDSAMYADIAREFGAEVPFLRPVELSGDLATDLEVFQHALEWLRREENYQPDICVHLRPTYPTRCANDIDAIVQLLVEMPSIDSVRSVAPAPFTPFKMWFRDEASMLKPVVQSSIPEAYNLPRQSLPVVYLQNACIDAVRTRVIHEQQSMTGDHIYGYVTEGHDDIDSEQDFQHALIRGGLSCNGDATSAGFQRRVICVDIDGVLATIVPSDRYEQAEPIQSAIASVNKLYDAGHEIVLFTARGSATCLDWRAVTERQMQLWNVRYHRLLFGKPAADIYVDDRALVPAQLTALANELAPTHGGCR